MPDQIKITVVFTMNSDDLREAHANIYEDAPPDDVGDAFSQILDAIMFDPDADVFVTGQYEITNVEDVDEPDNDATDAG